MNKMYVSFICLLNCSFLFTSCHKTYACFEPGESKTLVGTWKWLGTSGGIANHIHDTPASTGQNIYLTLSANGQYSIQVNNSIKSQGSYTLPTRQCIHDHGIKQVITFSNPADPQMMVESLSSSTLELSDDAYDGVSSSYVRK